MFWNIRNRIIIPAVVLIVVGVAISSYVTFVKAQKALRDSISGNMEVMAGGITKSLHEMVEGNLKDMQLQAERSEFKLLFSPMKAPGTVDKANAALKDVLSFYPQFSSIKVVGKDGTVVASSSPSQVGKLNVANRDYFQKAISGTPNISDGIKSKSTGKLMFIMAVPIKFANSIAGIVYGTVDLDEFSQNNFDPVRVMETGYAMLIGSSGKALAHPDKNELLKLDFNESEWGRTILQQKNGRIVYEYKGVEKIVEFRQDPTTQWIICINVPVEEINAPVRAILETTVVINCIIIVLVGLALFIIIRGIVSALGKTVDFATKVADGDLDIELNLDRADEIGILAKDLGIMVSKLKNIIAMAEEKTAEAEAVAEDARRAEAEAEQAKLQAESAKREGMIQAAEQLERIVNEINSASGELSSIIEESANGSAAQRDRTSESATAMEEMNASVLEVAANASNAAESAEHARQQAENGSNIVENVVTAINRVSNEAEKLGTELTGLGEQAEGIGRIMSVISDIADQTNLLALNAAIEAARAGDAGRGFAVVADEVRKLAEKTMEATKEVGNAVGAIQNSTRNSLSGMETTTQSVQESTEYVSQAGESLRNITSIVEETADQVRTIATAAEEQSATSEQINRGTDEIHEIALRTNDSMASAEASVAALTQLNMQLSQLIDELKAG